MVTVAAVWPRLQSLCVNTSSTNTEKKWPLSDRKWSSSTTTCWTLKGQAHLRTSPSHQQPKVRSALTLVGRWTPATPSPTCCFQLRRPACQDFLPRRLSSKAFWDTHQGSGPPCPPSLVRPWSCDLRLQALACPLSVCVLHRCRTSFPSKPVWGGAW